MGKIANKNRPQQSNNRTIKRKSNKKYPNTKTNIQKTKFEKPKSDQLKKKDKFKNKRKSLINKIKLSEKQGLIDIKRKRRAKTAITGDLKQLKDALPSLDELFKLPRNDIKTGIKSFENSGNIKLLADNTKDKNNRRKEFMNRYKCFTSLLNDKMYQSNPRDTIASYVKNNIEN